MDAKKYAARSDGLEDGHFLVVHPLDDLPERKADISRLRFIRMTRAVRISLITLRAYLILMALLVAYHVIDLAIGT
jgi:hypothetical protein